MTTPELERFDAWRHEEAVDIRTHAAAFGETVEYAFLKRSVILYMRMTERFPNIGNALFDLVEYACYDPDIPLDLVAINKARAEVDYPPLGFVPPLRLKEEYRAPRPSDVPDAPPPPIQGPNFYEWAVDKLVGIRHSAVAKGRDVVQEFLETQHMYINSIQRNFPDVGAARGLMLMRMWIHDKVVAEAPLDEQRLRGIRLWHGSVTEVAEAVEARMRGEPAPPEPLKS